MSSNDVILFGHDAHTELRAVQAELARWTYRPGWTFELKPEPVGRVYGAVLIIRYEAPDSRTPGVVTTIQSRTLVDPILLQDMIFFGKWLQHEIFNVERHESREWLRRDGHLYDDPHANAKRVSNDDPPSLR